MTNTLYFSKSKYCELWQCPKIAWLRKYKPEQFTRDDSFDRWMETGNEVGDLAMGLFGPYVEVTACNGDRLDLTGMIRRTSEEMQKQTPVICEASFSWKGIYCAVDILRREDGGWAIYEVKSSTNPEKEVYFADIAYQYYVLMHCGVRVTGIYLVTLNCEYVFDGTIRMDELFCITDVSAQVAEELPQVDDNITLAREILSKDQELLDMHFEPPSKPIQRSLSCHKPSL